MYDPIPFIEHDDIPELRGRSAIAEKLGTTSVSIKRYEALGILPKPIRLGPRRHVHDIKRIPKMLSEKQMAAREHVTGATIRRWVSEGLLPRPYKIGPNCTRWLESEVDEMAMRLGSQETMAGA